MGLFSNNKKGKGSHPFFHKGAKISGHTSTPDPGSDSVRTAQSMLFVKQYDILSIFKEILMPQNQN
ncbi:MAG: hypothetical protein LBJ04_12740 [Sphingobacterium sp.]|uniref:hypothetical protein n=1 Tax=Sphingobacterium sp. TaxID=341027 RepID=UPI002819697C|nr:hypothetical protein [Sphingobacterium sp.]MDR0264081.1 hypothetical protein [Sphingobacterium sp.]